MICPACGLPNALSAEICVGCHHPLPPSSAEHSLDPDQSPKPTGSPAAGDTPVSFPGNLQETEDSLQPQSNQIRVPDLKQGTFETSVKDFLDRDFVRTEGPRSSTPEQTAHSQEPPPTTPEHSKARPPAGNHPAPGSPVKSKPVQAAGPADAATAKKRQETLFSEKHPTGLKSISTRRPFHLARASPRMPPSGIPFIGTCDRRRFGIVLAPGLSILYSLSAVADLQPGGHRLHRFQGAIHLRRSGVRTGLPRHCAFLFFSFHHSWRPDSGDGLHGAGSRSL